MQFAVNFLQFYSLKNIEIKDQKVENLSLINISEFKAINPKLHLNDDHLIFTFEIEYNCFLNHFLQEKNFEYFFEKVKKETLHAIKRNFGQFKVIASFKINLINLINILVYHNEKNNSIHSYFILNKFSFKLERHNNEKSYYNELFIFRNFNDEIDNLKYLSTISTFQMDFSLEIFNFLINNKNTIFLQNESKINKLVKSNEKLSNYLESIIISTPINFYFLSLISENVITYYETIDFFKAYSYEIKNFQEKDFLVFKNSLKLILLRNSNNKKYIFKENLFSSLKDKFDLLIKTKEILLESIDYAKEHRQETFRILYNPISCIFSKPLYEISNRVMRKFSSNELMIRFSLKTIDNDQLKSKCEFTQLYAQFLLIHGFKLNKLIYQFFGYSNSQFRSASCWLCVNAEQIRKKCGDFSNIVSIAKYGARLGQCLTSTNNGYSIDKNIVKYAEEYKSDDKSKDLSDGVCFMTKYLAEKIKNHLKLKFLPAVFQARFGGCKGCWSVVNYKGESISYRKSQKKFSSEDTDFEVCEYSRYRIGHLNRQIITLLSTLGVPDEVFEKLQKTHLDILNNTDKYYEFIQNKKIQNLVKKMHKIAKLNPNNQIFLYNIFVSNFNLIYTELKDKTRIYVEKSTILKGIIDEYGILNYGESFAIVSESNNPDDEKNLHLSGKLIVTRNPCMHPGDIRILDFIKKSPSDYLNDQIGYKKYKSICKLVNVIIFPQRGKKSHPDEMAGGDLDGDDFFIFWDETLMKNEKNEKIKIVEPYSYPAQKEKSTDKITINQVIDNFVRYSSKSTLGKISHLYMAIVDISPEKAFDKNAIDLAEEFAATVDAPKTGYEGKIKKEIKDRIKTYPNYLGKPESQSHDSNFVLGKLYKTVIKIDPNEYKAPKEFFEIDYLNLFNDICEGNFKKRDYVKFYFLYVKECLIAYQFFEREIRLIMKEYNVKTYIELYTCNLLESSKIGKETREQIENIRDELKILINKYKEKFVKNRKYERWNIKFTDIPKIPVFKSVIYYNTIYFLQRTKNSLINYIESLDDHDKEEFLNTDNNDEYCFYNDFDIESTFEINDYSIYKNGFNVTNVNLLQEFENIETDYFDKYIPQKEVESISNKKDFQIKKSKKIKNIISKKFIFKVFLRKLTKNISLLSKCTSLSYSFIFREDKSRIIAKMNLSCLKKCQDQHTSCYMNFLLFSNNFYPEDYSIKELKPIFHLKDSFDTINLHSKCENCLSNKKVFLRKYILIIDDNIESFYLNLFFNFKFNKEKIKEFKGKSTFYIDNNIPFDKSLINIESNKYFDYEASLKRIEIISFEEGNINLKKKKNYLKFEIDNDFILNLIYKIKFLQCKPLKNKEDVKKNFPENILTNNKVKENSKNKYLKIIEEIEKNTEINYGFPFILFGKRLINFMKDFK